MLSNENIATFVTIMSVVCVVGGGIWGQALWLSRQFLDVRLLIDSKIEKLQLTVLDKIDYHEKHDDTRFQDVKNDIWDIRVRNAARDGLTPLVSRNRDKRGSNEYRTINESGAERD